MSITVAYGQTSLDIALQGMGDVERVFDVALLNGGSITQDLVPGTIVEIPAPALDKQKMVNLFSIPFNKPASDVITPIFAGIGYWYVDRDFKTT
jgi:hypothetical protein